MKTGDIHGDLRKAGRPSHRNLLRVIASYLLALLSSVSTHAQEDSAEVRLAADTADCQHYFDIGLSYMFPVDRERRPDYDSAALFFEKTISCDPQSLGSYVNAAACHMKTANFRRSRELLLRLLQLRPNFLKARLMLGHYYREVDSLSEANVQDSLISGLLEPHNAERRLDRFKRYRGVIRDIRNVGSLGVENAGLHLHWGKALMQLLDPGATRAQNNRRIGEAVVEFRRAVALAPDNPQAHLWLGHGLSLLWSDSYPGHGKEACREYRMVLKLNPENKEARRGIERLECFRYENW
jgi:tetratricopeptide (TPR) repeat protein